MFGLDCALGMLLREGLPSVFERHRLLANAVRTAVEAWGSNGLMRFNIEPVNSRANSVTAIELESGKAPQLLLDWCENNASVRLGITIGDLHNKGFRIGHMGYVNAPMVLGVLGVIETGLHTLGWEFGSSGLAAAAEELGRSLPKAS